MTILEVSNIGTFPLATKDITSNANFLYHVNIQYRQYRIYYLPIKRASISVTGSTYSRVRVLLYIGTYEHIGCPYSTFQLRKEKRQNDLSRWSEAEMKTPPPMQEMTPLTPSLGIGNETSSGRNLQS